MTTVFDEELGKFLDLLLADGGMHEIRALDVVRSTYPHKSEHSESGYFKATGFDEIVNVARHFRDQRPDLPGLPTLTGVGGVYYTLNPIKAAAYGKAPGQMVAARRGQSSTDADVERRTTLLIDIDSPREVKGVPATDEEKTWAHTLKARILSFLGDQGWPAPIEVDSGNGYQMLYRIDLPADDGGLVDQVLAALGARFTGADGDIDQSVHNAARIARLPCTWNRKAHSTAERPHRMARVVAMPATFQAVPTELLRKIAGAAPIPPKNNRDSRSNGGSNKTKVGNGSIVDAVHRWNADHPTTWPSTVSQCPICESPDGLKASTADAGRWCCFSSRHGQLTGKWEPQSGLGTPGNGCFTGDALDVEAWTSKRTRTQVLKDAGYLAGSQPRRGRTPKPSPADRNPDKPTVMVPGEHAQLRVGTDEFVAKVMELLPRDALYRRDQVVGEIVGARGHKRFEVATEHRARVIIDSHLQLEVTEWNESKADYEIHYRPCSRDLACLFLATTARVAHLRELRAIVHYPVFGRDFVLVEPGWNETQGIYYDEPAELEGLQPQTDHPLGVFDDLTVDFPFRDDASQENAYGMLLTPICAHAIRGNLPFHLVFASLERTGKGLLIDTLLGIVVLGEDSMPTMQLGRTEEEREKRITSAIIRGTTLVHFDNLPSEDLLDSASLASLATSRVWSGRPLGQSQILSLPNTLIPVFSGNNPKATGELTKRTVPIGLQPKDDRPEERTDFIHADLRAYARENRRAVLEATLGMVQNWRDAGCPPPPGKIRMGGFEDWVRVVGGILHHAGATKWMTNYSKWVRAGDEFAADATVLVAEWTKTFGEAEIKPAHVLAMVRRLEVFPRVIAGLETGIPIRLAKQVLGPLENRPVEGYLLRKRSCGNASLYSLTRACP